MPSAEQWQYMKNAHIIDLSKLTKGYYTMRITTVEGVAVRKVVRK